ncbi:hypothetical protein NC653_030102 [Populus alba x Populus x berolinensis]|uniref:Uncharacterized protein n=1 Tax=Populus alba x Populus x berolinensis TaxID=444605 RepID=A0AAD6Q026_9ROSI|nr:hypothetical protein NC653_030102 [Populus alba x Populus x berolinensis]
MVAPLNPVGYSEKTVKKRPCTEFSFSGNGRKRCMARLQELQYTVAAWEKKVFKSTAPKKSPVRERCQQLQ